MDEKEIMELCFPPQNRPDLPYTITNQLWKSGAIRDILTELLANPKMDTLIAVAPFISTYFVRFLSKTNLKNLILLINRKDFNPTYVDNAVNMLKNAKFHVLVRKRPQKSRFIHMKLLVPYLVQERVVKKGDKNAVESALYPYCAISGSVNFTKNGISISDEALFVLKDKYNINALVVTYQDLLKGSELVYDSSNPRLTPRPVQSQLTSSLVPRSVKKARSRDKKRPTFP